MSATIAPAPPQVNATHPVVYFDGVCGMCNVAVNFLMGIDRHARLRFAPLQGTTAAQNVPQADRESLKSIVLQSGGQTWRNSSALVRVLWTVGGLWRVPAALLWVVPRPLRDAGYAFVSANRYRLLGQKEVCRLPTPEERARFLD